MTKLYEVPKYTRFTVVGDEEKTKFLLDHIDGMYAYCNRCFDNKVVNNSYLVRKVVHIAAFTDVELVDK